MKAKTELQCIIEELEKYKLFEYPMFSLEAGYKETFNSRMETYIDKISKLPNGELSSFLKEQLSTIKNTYETINSVITSYLSGDNAHAYYTFNAYMNNIRYYLEDLSYTYRVGESFYRIRVSEKEINNKKEIFHIPYDKRQFVSTQRYSIAGVPSLYLGNSIYVCWQELAKPDLSRMYISQFITERELKILDFAITFKTLDIKPTIKDPKAKEYTEKKIKAFFVLYPLILASSFTKQYENAPFHIEYIIPNMILQWLSNEKEHFDGIRYFSTKMKHERYDSIGVNIVLPTKEHKSSLEKDAFCPRLKRTFKYTAPVSWALINTFPDAHQTFRAGGDFNIKNDQRILQNIEELVLKHYKITRFYKVEENIQCYFEPLFMDDNTRPKNFDPMRELF